MANDPAFLFYPGDYLRDTQCLDSDEQVAYDRIMCEHMRNICIRQERLNFFTKRLTDDQKSNLLSVLDEGPGGYQISWVVQSIEKRRAYSESRRKNRQSKQKTYDDHVITHDEHMENENENENRKRKKKEKEAQFRKDALEVIEFFNEHAGRSFDPTKNGATFHVMARLREGYTSEDCQVVIWHKIKQWGGDEKMKTYLRPQTLFNSDKFESYKAEAWPAYNKAMGREHAKN